MLLVMQPLDDQVVDKTRVNMIILTLGFNRIFSTEMFLELMTIQKYPFSYVTSSKRKICCLIELEWLENTPWLHVLAHQESFQPPYGVNQISVASLVAVSLMHIQSLHYHEQLHCCLCAEVQPSWRYGVLLWPTFCSVSHSLAFIGILGVAKHDARQLLSCSRRGLTCDAGVWMSALSFSMTSMNMLGDREEWGFSCNQQVSVMSYHSLHLAGLHSTCCRESCDLYVSRERDCGRAWWLSCHTHG